MAYRSDELGGFCGIAHRVCRILLEMLAGMGRNLRPLPCSVLASRNPDATPRGFEIRGLSNPVERCISLFYVRCGVPAYLLKVTLPTSSWRGRGGTVQALTYPGSVKPPGRRPATSASCCA